MISKQKDTDQLILLEIEDDKKLLEICSLNSKINEDICDENFWRQRIEKKYPLTIQYKKEETSWKDYYLKVIYYIDELKILGYKYKQGNPEKVYAAIKNYADGLLIASAENLTDVVEFLFLKRNIRNPGDFEFAMEYAGKYGNLELAQFLLERAMTVLDYENLPYVIKAGAEGALKAKNYDFIKKLNPDYYDDLVKSGYIKK